MVDIWHSVFYCISNFEKSDRAIAEVVTQFPCFFINKNTPSFAINPSVKCELLPAILQCSSIEIGSTNTISYSQNLKHD